MLSFGHAVYYGLGGFLAVHAHEPDRGLESWPILLPVAAADRRHGLASFSR